MSENKITVLSGTLNELFRCMTLLYLYVPTCKVHLKDGTALT